MLSGTKLPPLFDPGYLRAGADVSASRLRPTHQKNVAVRWMKFVWPVYYEVCLAMATRTFKITGGGGG